MIWLSIRVSSSSSRRYGITRFEDVEGCPDGKGVPGLMDWWCCIGVGDVGALSLTAPAACSWLSIAAGLLIATRLNDGEDKVDELFRRCTGVCGGGRLLSWLTLLRQEAWGARMSWTCSQVHRPASKHICRFDDLFRIYYWSMCVLRRVGWKIHGLEQFYLCFPGVSKFATYLNFDSPGVHDVITTFDSVQKLNISPRQIFSDSYMRPFLITSYAQYLLLVERS